MFPLFVMKDQRGSWSAPSCWVVEWTFKASIWLSTTTSHEAPSPTFTGLAGLAGLEGKERPLPSLPRMTQSSWGEVLSILFSLHCLCHSSRRFFPLSWFSHAIRHTSLHSVVQCRLSPQSLCTLIPCTLPIIDWFSLTQSFTATVFFFSSFQIFHFVILSFCYFT